MCFPTKPQTFDEQYLQMSNKVLNTEQLPQEAQSAGGSATKQHLHAEHQCGVAMSNKAAQAHIWNNNHQSHTQSHKMADAPKPAMAPANQRVHARLAVLPLSPGGWAPCTNPQARTGSADRLRWHPWRQQPGNEEERDRRWWRVNKSPGWRLTKSNTTTTVVSNTRFKSENKVHYLPLGWPWLSIYLSFSLAPCASLFAFTRCKIYIYDKQSSGIWNQLIICLNNRCNSVCAAAR